MNFVNARKRYSEALHLHTSANLNLINILSNQIDKRKVVSFKISQHKNMNGVTTFIIDR